MDKEILTPTNLGGLMVSSPQRMKKINFLVYGESGIGKTQLCASASLVPSCAPVLLIDCEQGSTSAKNFPKVSVVQPQTMTEVLQVLKSLREFAAKAASDDSEFEFPYGTVILETATELQKLSMSDILKKGVEKAKALDRDKDPDVPEISDHGRVLNQMTNLVRAFRNLPCNFLLTCHASIDTTIASRPKAKPMLTGRFADELPGMMDIVLYMSARKSKNDPQGPSYRTIQTATTAEAVAKDRSETLPKLMLETDFPEIFDYIEGNKTTEEENKKEEKVND